MYDFLKNPERDNPSRQTEDILLVARSNDLKNSVIDHASRLGIASKLLLSDEKRILTFKEAMQLPAFDI